MKTAIIILSNIPKNINTETYLLSCSNKVRKAGYILIHSAAWSDYRDINMTDFIDRMRSQIDAIFLFVDFGINQLMMDLVNKYYDRDNYYMPFSKEIKIELSSCVLPLTLNYILNEVSDKLSIPIDLMKGRIRKREIVEARQIFFFRVKQLTTYSLDKMGKAVNRDHATALHGIRNVWDIRELNEKYNLHFGTPKKKIIDIPKIKNIYYFRPNRVFKARESIQSDVKRTSPFINVLSTNNRAYSGYREHSL